MVFTILSNWEWFWLMLNQTTNSEIFSEYICKFNDWINENNYFSFKNLIIMFDNWSIHRSRNNLRLMETMEHQIVFIPAYSPQFVPIEMWFNYVKQILKNKWRHIVWNLSNMYSHNKVWETLKLLDKRIVANCFKAFYAELKRCLSSSSPKQK